MPTTIRFAHFHKLDTVSVFLKSSIHHVQSILNNQIQNMSYTSYMKNSLLHTNELLLNNKSLHIR